MLETVSASVPADHHTSKSAFTTSRNFYERRMVSIVAKWQRSGETWTHYLGEDQKMLIRERSDRMRAVQQLPQYQKLSGTAKLLLVKLVESVQEASHVWQVTAKGEHSMVYGCWCGVEWMMNVTGRKRRAVHYTLKQLETAGFLRRKHTRNQTLTYVMMPTTPSLDVRTAAHPLDVQLPAHRMSQKSTDKNQTDTGTLSEQSVACETPRAVRRVREEHPRVKQSDTDVLTSPSDEVREARIHIAKKLRALGVKSARQCSRMTNLIATGETDEETLSDSINAFVLLGELRRWTLPRTVAWMIGRGDYWHLPFLHDDYKTQQNESGEDAWIYAALRREAAVEVGGDDIAELLDSRRAARKGDIR